MPITEAGWPPFGRTAWLRLLLDVVMDQANDVGAARLDAQQQQATAQPEPKAEDDDASDGTAPDR